MQQKGAVCEFRDGKSWVILSPIEQSIKRKIEVAGTPLKDWNINICRGVLTGCNDAFIITSEKRDEILFNCKDEDERARTDALIRPILRGRDIKRYSYNWAGLWLINTHNGMQGKIPRVDINDYPAIKQHLDKYWDKISIRADRGDTPYNLRNCAYLEDLSQPKIVWIELSDEPKFAISELMPLNTVFYLIGERIYDIIGMLNSTIYKWYFTHCIGTTSGVGTNRWLKYTIEQVPLIKHHIEISHITEKIVNNEISEELGQLEIDKILFNILELTNDEIDVIKNY